MVVTLTLGTPATGTGGSIVVPVPGTQAGDVSVIGVAATTTSSGQTITTPAGWNTIPPGSTRASGVITAATSMFWKAWAPGDPTTVTVTVVSGNSLALPFLLQGALTSAPIEASGATPGVNMTATTDVNAPSLTAVDSRLLVCFYGTRNSSSGSTAGAWNTPTGMTELVDTKTASGGYIAIGALDYQVLSAAGATGTRTSRCSTNHSPIAWSLLIEPAPPAAGSVLRTQAGLVTTKVKP